MPPGKWAFAVAVLSLSTSASAVQPGDIVKGVDGLAVASAPAAPNQTVLRGSPALVIAVRGQWTRLLAADGACGWTSRQFSGAAHARIAGRAQLELSERSPDDPSIEPGIETFQAAAKDASIIGASRKTRVASPRQLILPPRLNPFLTPWLEIRSESRSGWIVPAELPLEWGEPAGAGDVASAMDRLGLNGIVREPFLGPVREAFLASYHASASVLRFENISSKPERVLSSDAAVQALNALVRLAPGWVAAFSGDRGFVFLFSNAGAAVVSEGTPIVARAAAADLNGDGKPELVLQLASIYGDGYRTALWIVDGDSGKGLAIASAPLGGSSGEPGGGSVEAAWWIDASTLWIARVDAKRVEYELAAYGTSKEPPRRAYAAVAGRFPSRDAAERRAIALRDGGNFSVQTFPFRLANGPVEWAAGRLFQEQAQAKAWQPAASMPVKIVDVSSLLLGALPK